MHLSDLPLVLWINLDRSLRRRQNMIKLFDTHHLVHRRIAGVDGTGRELSVLNNLCDTSLSLSPAENACTCSHLLAARYLLEKTSETHVLVFEDDVSFAFLELIPYSWTQFISHLPDNWQMVQLAVTTESGSPPCHLVSITPASKHYCSAAYLLSRTGAEYLLNTYWLSASTKINLQDQEHVTADSMIASIPHSYSIPIFSYETMDSVIHPNHLYIHNRAKYHQYIAWECFQIEYQRAARDGNGEEFLTNYFERFSR